MNSTTKEEFKTPTYIRKASKNYYQRLRADPKKYAEYLEKRRNYNRKKALEKKKISKANNKEKKDKQSNNKEEDDEIEGETILI